jgi:hypothetical protein
MTKRIQLRRDTTANWTSVDPVLAAAEVGVDLTTGQIKIGDGEASWTELSYYTSSNIDLSGYATESYVDDAVGSIVIPDVSNFITAEDLPEPVDLSGYALTTDIPDVSNFITVEDIPAIPADISDLTDTTNLLSGGIDSDPTQLLFEAGDDEDLVSHSAGFVEGAPVFQIRLNTHLSSEEQTVWGFDTDGTTEFPDAIKLRWAGDKSLAGTIGTGPGGFSLVGEPGKEFAIVLTDTEENSSFWSFSTDGTLNLPNDGELVFNRSGTEAGKIIPSTSTGGGLQVEAQSDFEIKVTQGEGEEVETAIWSFEAGGDLVFPDGSIQTTAYTGEGNSGSSDRLVNGELSVVLDEDGVVILPQGGTITEGVVTDNPTIELTPAMPEAESQKLVIKGGAGPTYTNEENGIEIATYTLTVTSGQLANFDVFAPTYEGETFYWWVDLYSPGEQFTPDNGEITITDGYANIQFTVNDDTVPLKIYVADALYNAYANNKGAVSVTVNGEPQEPEDSYHLHLTTGDLQETSVILGTDEHNVRTKINGSVELTSADYDNQNTYRLNFKNNVLRISSTAEPDEEDLFIKAEDDLYLDALGDDVFVRANDDIRLRTGYDFESSDYNWQFRFTDSGEQIIYNDQDGFDYGRITPNLFDEGVRGLTLEGENQLRLRVANSGSELILNSDGGLIFPDGDIQTTAYAGNNGRLMFIDTNRTGDYTENGSADKPFKTFTAAIEAVAELNPNGTVPYTFVLMGCGINETVDFSSRNFNFITISTTCRSVFNQPVTFGNSALKQLTIRNVEFGDTFTITGDGTADQLNNVSIYNASFSGVVNITATNATAFYEAAFFGAVNFTNLSYLYINGAQFNADWTITADSDGVIPSRGINPGTGGSIAIVFGTIANNVIFVKGGTAACVFQPHMTRLGRTTETYTVPAGWTVAAYSTVFRGNWVNNGSFGLRNSSTDNRVKGTAAAVAGIIGGDRVIAKLAPATSKGVEGDRQGMIAADSTYYYVCTADWTDGVADIWSRNPLASGTW